MPRKCTGCDYTTDDPFLGTCPWCAKSLAIVSTAGNRQSARVDWRRERTGRHSLRAIGSGWWPGGGWGVWVMLTVVVGGLFYVALAGGGRRDARSRSTPSPASRLSLGMSLRDAVLALEPVRTADGLSLHGLLDSDQDTASGTFTFCDNSPFIRVTFRNGRVTGVSEQSTRLPPGGARRVEIQLE